MHKPGRIRSNRWRDIASLCSIEPRTIPSIAAAMQVRPGSIQALIHSMREENLLEEVESSARGVSLRLTRHGRAELRKHAATGGVEALLSPGERLVFVIDEGRGVSPETLAQLADDPDFRWAARVDGPVKWIASLGSDDAVAADRAANTLVEGGARAVVGRADAFFDAEGLAEFAEALKPTPRPKGAIGSAKT